MILRILNLVALFFISYPFNRNVFSKKRQITQGCVSTGVGTSASITATAVVSDGISPLMAQSVLLQQLLMPQSICIAEQAADWTICTTHVTSKEFAIKFTKELCAWDSGSAAAQVTVLLMRPQAGNQCPGSTWKKYLPHKFNNSRFRYYS